MNMVNIFIAYASKDEAWLHELEIHMGLLKRQRLVSTWYKRLIAPGTDWSKSIDEHLEEADIILLLISADFLADDYCYHTEMQRALALHKAGRAEVVPIIVRPTDWADAPFAHLKSLPDNASPISTAKNQDEALVNVIEGLRQVIQRRAGNKSVISTSEGEEQVPSRSSQDQQKLEADLLANRPQIIEEFATETRQMQRAGFLASAKASGSLRFSEPFPKNWNVPRRHNTFFTGRTPVLEQLFDGFSQEDEAGMVLPQAIIGLGGMGKTQVAAEFAFRFRGHYQAVFWVQADTQENLVADFRTLAEVLDCASTGLQHQNRLIRTVHEWFRQESDWLLIFDNADDPVLVDPFLPRSGQGHTLLTTRYTAIVEQAQPLRLEALKPDDGALCILRRSGILKPAKPLSDASSTNRETALQLAQLMNGLPLALEQAGAYINDTGCSIVEYLELYEHYRQELQKSRHGPFLEYPESVASTWRIARSRVEQRNPAAAEILRLCAYFAPEAIPIELFRQAAHTLGPILGPVAADPLAFNEAISLLRQHSLVTREADRTDRFSRISIHRIMQEIIRDEMDADAQDTWSSRAICAIASALPTLPWPVLQAHALQCAQFIQHKRLSFPEAEALQQWIEQHNQPDQPDQDEDDASA